MLLMLEFGEVQPATFLYSGGFRDPMHGVIVHVSDTADSLMLAFEDTIDVVELNLGLPPAAGAGSSASGSRGSIRGIRTPSRRSSAGPPRQAPSQQEPAPPHAIAAIAFAAPAARGVGERGRGAAPPMSIGAEFSYGQWSLVT